MSTTGQPKVSFSGRADQAEFNYQNISGSFVSKVRKGTTRKNKNTRSGIPATENQNKRRAYAPENKPLKRHERREIKKYAQAEGEIRNKNLESPEEYAWRISQELIAEEEEEKEKEREKKEREKGVFTKVCNALGQCFLRFMKTKKHRRNNNARRKNRKTRKH